MTDSTTKPDTKPERVSLSVTQVVASVLAAVSASVAASVFGVAGTVIGAALGSAITVVGSAVYAQSLQRSREAVRLTVASAAARRQGGRGPEPAIPPEDPDTRPDERGTDERGTDERGTDERGTPPDGGSRRLWVVLTPRRLAVGAGALFVLTLGLITGFELLTGQPVAASIEGQQGSGVSILGGTEGSRAADDPTPTSTAPTSTAPSSTAPASTAPASTAPVSTAPASTGPSGTSGPTPTVTVTLTPSATPSVTPPATPSTTAPASGPTGGTGPSLADIPSGSSVPGNGGTSGG